MAEVEKQNELPEEEVTEETEVVVEGPEDEEVLEEEQETADKFYDNAFEYRFFSGVKKREFEEKCNPENGWGSIASALLFLNNIREVAVKNPSAVCLVCS